MIKALRITGILVILAALGFVVFVASQGMQTDDSIEKFLSSPGVAEQMKGSSSVKTSDSGQNSPLIRQAKAFALRINPPPPPAAKVHRRPPVKVSGPPRPKVEKVTANFTLLGTSSHQENENESWALINEVGKGLRWVKQGQSVGRLVIAGIGRGVVLIDDNGKTYELTVKHESKPDYVKSYSGTLPEKSPDKSWQTGQVREIASSVTKTPSQVAEPTAENVRGNIEWLKKLQADPAMAGLSEDEANGVGGLGEMLKSLEKDLQRISGDKSDKSDKGDKGDKNEPNLKVPDEVKKPQNQPQNKVSPDVEARKKAVEALMNRRKPRTRR